MTQTLKEAALRENGHSHAACNTMRPQKNKLGIGGQFVADASNQQAEKDNAQTAHDKYDKREERPELAKANDRAL